MKSILMSRAHVLAIVALALVACSTAARHPKRIASVHRAQPQASERIALTPYFRGLKTAALHIDGSDYRFLVDTGGGRTLISPTLAAQLACTPAGTDVGYRMSGEPVVFRNCPRLQARLSSFKIDVAPVAVFDLGAVLPRELPPLDGVLALDSFRGQVLTIDWSGNALVVHSSVDGTDALVQRGLPARFATGENGAALSVLLPVQSAHDGMWFLLDSGDIKGTLVSRHLVADGSMQPSAESVVSMRVGNAPAEDFQVTIDDINYDGVLGTAFLQTHVIALDLRDAP